VKRSHDVSRMQMDRMGFLGQGWQHLLVEMGLTVGKASNTVSTMVKRLLHGVKGVGAVWQRFGEIMELGHEGPMKKATGERRDCRRWVSEELERARGMGVCELLRTRVTRKVMGKVALEDLKVFVEAGELLGDLPLGGTEKERVAEELEAGLGAVKKARAARQAVGLEQLHQLRVDTRYGRWQYRNQRIKDRDRRTQVEPKPLADGWESVVGSDEGEESGSEAEGVSEGMLDIGVHGSETTGTGSEGGMAEAMDLSFTESGNQGGEMGGILNVDPGSGRGESVTAKDCTVDPGSGNKFNKRARGGGSPRK